MKTVEDGRDVKAKSVFLQRQVLTGNGRKKDGQAAFHKQEGKGNASRIVQQS